MNTIDQRILIPTDPETVWAYISDLNNNPNWQADCRSVTFLTSAHKGQHVRWRAIGKNKKARVTEITAWYERVGYEYKIVDGSPYKDNLGRLRLQEVPEGTIVQWTFRYSLGGLLAGARNALGIRRQVESSIANSLWELWRRITALKSSAAGSVDYTSKSLMRDAPDVESRSQYRPRHPSLVVDRQPIIAEPPFSDDDTRPNLAIENVGDEGEVAPSTVGEQETDYTAEPDFLGGVVESIVPEVKQPTAPAVIYSSPVDAVPAQQPSRTETPSEVRQVDTTPAKLDLPYLKESDSEIDTGKVSVFDLFGIPKPSETQEIDTVETPAEPATVADVKALQHPARIQQSLPYPGRAGRRLVMRYRRIKARLPK